MDKKIPIEISARHVHLSQKHLEKLFGKGHKLVPERKLSQPGQFAAKETVVIQKGKNKISKIRLIGPVRAKTQIELSLTDAFELGIKIPIRLSGNLKNSPSATLIGPRGRVNLKDGLICASRHLHLQPDLVKIMKLKTGDKISVKVEGERSIIFNNVAVRSGEGHKLGMHIDTDEGNAAGIIKRGQGKIIKPCC